jgi:GNAT superfamily N-acetyltransferase
LTSSHAGESFDDALWYALFTAFPAEAYETTTCTTLIVSIAAPQYAHALHRVLGDPEAFSQRHLAAQPKSDHPVLQDVEVVQAADACWARDFGCSPTALRPRRTHVQQHAGTMTGDRGIWILVAGGSPLVSLPPELMPELSELARSWTALDVLDPNNVRWQVEERCRRPVERLVGPAFIGYWGLDGVSPYDSSPARPCADTAAIERLQRACPPLEWKHGGPDARTVAQFAVEDADGRLLALAGYEVWNETVAHLQVVTHPEHRGKGLGAFVVAAAAEHALNQGLFPQYRTLRSNAGSMAIARKLGFQDYGSSLYLI